MRFYIIVAIFAIALRHIAYRFIAALRFEAKKSAPTV